MLVNLANSAPDPILNIIFPLGWLEASVSPLIPELTLVVPDMSKMNGDVRELTVPLTSRATLLLNIANEGLLLAVVV